MKKQPKLTKKQVLYLKRVEGALKLALEMLAVVQSKK